MPNGSEESCPSLPAIEIVTPTAGTVRSPVLRIAIFINEVWPRLCSVGNCALVTFMRNVPDGSSLEEPEEPPQAVSAAARDSPTRADPTARMVECRRRFLRVPPKARGTYHGGMDLNTRLPEGAYGSQHSANGGRLLIT